jgi:hypothetical protein
MHHFFIVKCDSFLLLHAKSKFQNVVVVACCVQNLETKQQKTESKHLKTQKQSQEEMHRAFRTRSLLIN